VNNLHATFVNSPTFVNNNNGGFRFNGVNQYALGGNTAFVNNFHTLSIWFINTGAPSTNDTYGGMLFNQSMNFQHGIMMQHGWSGQAAAFGGNINNVLVSSINTVPVNNIINLIGVYNGSSQQIFLNGSLLVQRAWSTAPLTFDPAYQIATWRYSGFERYFNGIIYSVSLYNRAFTLQEIYQSFNATRGRFGI